jgi:hypothetical protein
MLLSLRQIVVPALAFASVSQAAVLCDSPESFLPVSYALSTAPVEAGLAAHSMHRKYALSKHTPVLTLDYGVDVAGFPYIDIVSGAGQIELKYTEDFDGLNQLYGDGPWTFVVGLANSFRTETFNITGPGRIQSTLLQGAQRWETVTLLTDDTIVVSSPGFEPSVEVCPRQTLPGSFSASNQNYTEIWGLGARAVQLACFDKKSQPQTWEITADGAYIQGQQPANSPLGYDMSDYTLEFMTKIVRGGTGWRVLSSAVSSGPYLILTSNYSAHSTFVNVNTTLLPANTLVVGNGPSIVNQTSLTTSANLYYPISMTILEDTWYNITTVTGATGIDVYINGTLSATVPLVNTGTWGFGPFMDQIAYVKDVQVTASNGTVIYQNDMKSDHTLAEYGVQSNTVAVCVDGGKRDRAIWVGDFVHTARVIAATTNRVEFIRGVIESSLSWQLPAGADGAGLVSTRASLGDDTEYKEHYYVTNYGITDYQIFFLLVIGDYYTLTNDLAFLTPYWTQVQALVSRMETCLDQNSGLLGDSYDSYYFTAGPVPNATAPAALFAYALRKLVPLAEAIEDTASATAYSSTAQSVADAINDLLWNPTTGTYGAALSDVEDYSLTAISFTILTGIMNATQMESTLAIALPKLFYMTGYKDSSSTTASLTTQLSPNTQGFLLEALLISLKNDYSSTTSSAALAAISNLLNVYWPQMLSTSRYYTGASWEYVFPDGSPGLELYTSLAHPWGSAPTYLLTQYVLGVSPKTAAYEQWSFEPIPALLRGGLEGLSWAEGIVPIPNGGAIKASWKVDQSTGRVKITARGPAHTTGVITSSVLTGTWSVNGVRTTLNGSYTVTGGKEVVLVGTI